MTVVYVSHHPFQRAGSFAAAAIVNKPSPEDLTADDLDAVVTTIVTDGARHHTASKTEPGGIWPLALSAAFTNNLPSDKRYTKGDVLEAERRLRDVFDFHDTDGAYTCTYCSRPAVHAFGKNRVPLVESDQFRNSTVRGVPGTPVCRTCLITLWALPYACTYISGRMVLVDFDDNSAARGHVDETLRHNRQSMALPNRSTSAHVGFHTVAFDHLRAIEARLPLSGAAIYVWRNGNQEADLERWRVEEPLVKFIRSWSPSSRRGFAAAARALTVKKANGRVEVGGRKRLVGALLSTNDRRVTNLLRAAAVRSADFQPQRLPDVRAFLHVYLTEVVSMQSALLTSLGPLAERVATLIGGEAAGKTHAFNAATETPKAMQAWLKESGLKYHLHVGGSEPFVAAPLAELLCSQTPEGGHARTALFFAVLEQLHTQDTEPIPDSDGEPVEDTHTAPEAMA